MCMIDLDFDILVILFVNKRCRFFFLESNVIVVFLVFGVMIIFVKILEIFLVVVMLSVWLSVMILLKVFIEL